MSLNDKIAAIYARPDYVAQIELARNRAREHPRNKTVNEEVVEFYGKNDPFGPWLSNCTRAFTLIDGRYYPSSEHYFQIAKFDGNTPQHIVNRDHMLTLSPVDVANYGREYRKLPIRPDWDQVRDSVMYHALREKFTQNTEFNQKLRETDDRVLIERAPNDKYWAIANTGEGQNRLGVLLMIVRDELHE